MAADKNIYLIGYRCTGKTTIGKKLAKRLFRPFVDTDVQVEHHIQATVANFVHTRGWEAFRKQESEVIRQLSRINSQVISTGGGLILDSDNRKILRQTGIVIWLDASEAVIISRMKQDLNTASGRPGLTGQSIETEVCQTMRQRYPLYENLADYKIDTSDKSMDDVLQIILENLGYER